MDDDPDQPVTATADEEILDLVQKWDDANRRLVLVTAGKPGVGKSTLINNLLGLKGEKAAKAKRSAKSVTKTVDYYEREIHGITVRIIDTPGLEARDLTREQEQEALAKLSEFTNGKPDLLLYCISLVGRFDDKDDRIVVKLTKVFGCEIWRHTVLVLTYGDELTDDEEKEELLEEFTEEFEEALKKAGVSDVPVKSILSTQADGPNLKSKLENPQIVGIPVGQYIQKPPDWAPLLFKEVIKRCRMNAIPALLVLQGVTPHSITEVIGSVGEGVVESVATVFGVFYGVVGAGLGGVMGAAIGATGGPGVVAGAKAGAKVGVDVGVTIGSGFSTGLVGSPGVAVTGSRIVAVPSVYGGMRAKKIIEEWTGLGMIIKARQDLEEKTHSK